MISFLAGNDCLGLLRALARGAQAYIILKDCLNTQITHLLCLNSIKNLNVHQTQHLRSLGTIQLRNYMYIHVGFVKRLATCFYTKLTHPMQSRGVKNNFRVVNRCLTDLLISHLIAGVFEDRRPTPIKGKRTMV